MPNRLLLLASCTFGLLFLSACGSSTADVLNPEDAPAADTAITDDAGTVNDDLTADDDMTDGNSSSEAPLGTAPTDARVIAMTATDWSFSPNAITAAQGERVVVRITGMAGSHSFAIPDLGINVAVNPGETKDIEIPTDKTGTFLVRCFVPCGAGHKDMTGTLVVS